MQIKNVDKKTRKESELQEEQAKISKALDDYWNEHEKGHTGRGKSLKHQSNCVGVIEKVKENM